MAGSIPKKRDQVRTQTAQQGCRKVSELSGQNEHKESVCAPSTQKGQSEASFGNEQPIAQDLPEYCPSIAEICEDIAKHRPFTLGGVIIPAAAQEKVSPHKPFKGSASPEDLVEAMKEEMTLLKESMAYTCKQIPQVMKAGCQMAGLEFDDNDIFENTKESWAARDMHGNRYKTLEECKKQVQTLSVAELLKEKKALTEKLKKDADMILKALNIMKEYIEAAA